MSPRSLGILLFAYALLSAVFQALRLKVPVFKVPFLAGATGGWLLLGVLLFSGVWMALRAGREWQFSPLTLKQFKRFRSIRRGYVAFLILVALVFVASLDNLIIGKRALVVSYEKQLYFPFVRNDVLSGKTFGLDYEAETDYRELKRKFHVEDKGNWVLMPFVPYDAKLDSPQTVVTMELRDGLLYKPGSPEKPYSGRVHTLFKDKITQKRQEFVYRKGIRHGEMRGWDMEGEQIEKGAYDQGKIASYQEYREGVAKALESAAAPEFYATVYPPSPPSSEEKHYLGTNTLGGDVLAVLFGGWQQAIIASLLYVPVVFGVGILVGGTLGYFGGLYDLLGQRLIEIWSVLPFLFIVIIVSSIISPTLVILVGIIAIFGWMGTTSYLRTATYREKSRDYVAAARLQGASTGRIIFRHVLPNVIAILVTLAPFEIAGIITALASLDFLGFGLPPDEPSWGRLLNEGTENFNYPWIVSSAFAAMVFVLLLVTFIGEAVREAFDPKKFTTYE